MWACAAQPTMMDWPGASRLHLATAVLADLRDGYCVLVAVRILQTLHLIGCIEFGLLLLFKLDPTLATSLQRVIPAVEGDAAPLLVQATTPVHGAWGKALADAIEATQRIANGECKFWTLVRPLCATGAVLKGGRA